MIYVLKHKNLDVLEFQLLETGMIKINVVQNYKHLPYPLYYKCNEFTFLQWFDTRLIPATRYQYDRFKKALELFDKNSRTQMILDNKALSLSDCYWIDKKNSGNKWEEVNYFENDIVPLFDYGNSLWYNFFPECIGNENINKMFEGMKASDALKFIKNKNSVDFNKLVKALGNIKIIFGKYCDGDLKYQASINRLEKIATL